jgi:hypothetical protein
VAVAAAACRARGRAASGGAAISGARAGAASGGAARRCGAAVRRGGALGRRGGGSSFPPTATFSAKYSCARKLLSAGKKKGAAALYIPPPF